MPTKLQLIWETVVDQVNTQVEDNLGKVHPCVAPLADLAVLLHPVRNWLELLPTELNDAHPHLLPSPTADTNLTYALAIITIVSVWVYGIRQRGLKGFFKHFFEPFPVMFPLNLLEELIKPITLALRLFGNIFAGGIMLALIAAGELIAGEPADRVLGAVSTCSGSASTRSPSARIQAFIFALLTVLYFAMAGAGTATSTTSTRTSTTRLARREGPPYLASLTTRSDRYQR